MGKKSRMKREAQEAQLSAAPSVEETKSSPGGFKTSKRNLFVAGLLISVLTFAAFSPVLQSEFTNWDDNRLIVENPVIKDLSAEGIKTIFTTFPNMHYKPLTFLSWALEYKMFKLDSKMFHLNNLLLHVFNTLLVFWLLRLLLADFSMALILALLFGLHPMHVESVAWATERKDVLYGFFYLGAMIAYLKYLRNDYSSKFYGLAIILFIASMLSKMMAISLPLVLFLLDRFEQRPLNRVSFFDKIPFLAIFLLPLFYMGGISQTLSYLSSSVEMPFSTLQTLLISSYQILFYFVKILFPFTLSAIYPYPNGLGGELPAYFMIFPLLLVIGGILIYAGRKNRILFFGSLFVLLSILPVLQVFLPSAHAIAADRYVYLPMIGVLLLLGIGLRDLIHKRIPNLKTLHPVIMLVFIIGYGYATFAQVKVWKNSETLWTDVINKFPDVAIAHNSRGNYHFQNENFNLAFQDYQRALAIKPDYPMALTNRGNIYKLNGDLDMALADFNKALELSPANPEAYTNKGVILYNQQQFEEAIELYDKAVEIDQRFVKAYFNRGIAYYYWAQSEYATGRYESAVANYNAVVKLNPDFVPVYKNRSLANFYIRRYDAAMADALKARELGDEIPDDWLDQIEEQQNL